MRYFTLYRHSRLRCAKKAVVLGSAVNFSINLRVRRANGKDLMAKRILFPDRA